MAKVPTMKAAADFRDKHPERVEYWKNIVRLDPDRAVRVLSGPNSASGDEDTTHDVTYVLAQLRILSQDAKSKTWKALVDAGVNSALCKCALQLSATIMHDGDHDPSRQDKKDITKAMAAPYHVPLEILCNAAVGCAIPPTATEKKMAAEIRQHWSPIMQRVWSEPWNTLEPEPRQIRLIERIVIPQIFVRLTMVDPSFLDIISKPTDLTLAVIFRYWLYSVERADNRLALAILVPLLDKDPSKFHPFWMQHLERNPAPPVEELLRKLFLGASRTAGKKKRTAAQTANAVVSAFAGHLEKLQVQDLRLEYDFFRHLFIHSQKSNNVFKHAVCKSGQFWIGNVSVLRRAAQ